MEAGREMDALVAEKVMGCSVMRENYHRTLGDGGKWEWLRCGCIGGPHNYRDDTARDGMLVYYSTDISAAWEVIDKLLSVGMSVELNAYPSARYDVRIYKSIPHDGGMPTTSMFAGEALDDTVPLAICRAALKAVGK